jgi:undecaprenyl-phosphate 4-deoxy-4-formamido-L-arabinose transferase
VERIQQSFSVFCATFELVLVNDGSRDRSWEVIQTLATRHSWIRGVNHMRNYGQHNAILTGIRLAQYELIVTMDDDLQNPPEEVPKLLAKLNEGHDVVYGTPEDRGGQTLRRYLASQVIRWVLSTAVSREVAQSISPFRVFRTVLRKAFAEYNSPNVSIDFLLTWATTRFAVAYVRHDARQFGTSTYTLRKLINHAINLLTGFTTWPLQIASVLGIVSAGFGILLLIYVIFNYLVSGSSVPGFAFIASMVSLFSGVQMFTIGVIGEYLARMYLRGMGRPASVIRDMIGTDESSGQEKRE